MAIAAAALVAALFGAPTAQATPEQDYIYYATLDNSGFVMWNPAEMRRQGLAVCVELVNRPWRIVMTEIMNIGYTLDESAMILSAAVTAYCPGLGPQDGPLVRAQ